ncbi:hypothetical protein V1511DRAFT_496833 [Dipodascopsis uninucleata]
MDVRNQLVEMGFPVSRIEAALRNIDDKTLENAIEWLEQHPIDKAIATTSGDANVEPTVDENGEPIEPGQISEEAGSLVCQDCNKRFRNATFAELHATKTKHTNFAESTESLPELTPEQKQAKLEELRKKAAERKAEAAKKDAIEAKNNEILRRKADRDSAALIEKQKKIQMMKEAEDRKKQALADKLAKERVKAQIEADKKARKEKLERERLARAHESGIQPPEQSPSGSTPSATTTTRPAVKKEYTESRLQIRVDGIPPIVKTFPVGTTLFEVAHAVQDETSIPATGACFLTTFPTKRYGPEDFGMTIKEAGLINTAIMLKRA